MKLQDIFIKAKDFFQLIWKEIRQLYGKFERHFRSVLNIKAVQTSFIIFSTAILVSAISVLSFKLYKTRKSRKLAQRELEKTKKAQEEECRNASDIALEFQKDLEKQNDQNTINENQRILNDSLITTNDPKKKSNNKVIMADVLNFEYGERDRLIEANAIIRRLKAKYSESYDYQIPSSKNTFAIFIDSLDLENQNDLLQKLIQIDRLVLKELVDNLLKKLDILKNQSKNLSDIRRIVKTLEEVLFLEPIENLENDENIELYNQYLEYTKEHIQMWIDNGYSTYRNNSQFESSIFDTIREKKLLLDKKFDQNKERDERIRREKALEEERTRNKMEELRLFEEKRKLIEEQERIELERLENEKLGREKLEKQLKEEDKKQCQEKLKKEKLVEEQKKQSEQQNVLIAKEDPLVEVKLEIEDLTPITVMQPDIVIPEAKGNEGSGIKKQKEKSSTHRHRKKKAAPFIEIDLTTNDSKKSDGGLFSSSSNLFGDVDLAIKKASRGALHEDEMEKVDDIIVLPDLLVNTSRGDFIHEKIQSAIKVINEKMKTLFTQNHGQVADFFKENNIFKKTKMMYRELDFIQEDTILDDFNKLIQLYEKFTHKMIDSIDQGNTFAPHDSLNESLMQVRRAIREIKTQIELIANELPKIVEKRIRREQSNKIEVRVIKEITNSSIAVN